MKNLAHPSFFRVFDLLVAETNPGLKRSSWTHDGVAWERERQADAFTSPGFTALFAMLRRELSDEYFAAIVQHLRRRAVFGGEGMATTGHEGSPAEPAAVANE
jgi:hypothetical protein